VAAALALLFSLGSPAPVDAQRSLVVEAFDIALTVREDGTMLVVESVRYRFTGSWNGVFRDIPIQYRTPRGLEHRLELDDIVVTNPAGGSYRHELSREGRNRRIKVWVPGATDATHTVEFRYSVRNPLLFFNGAGEGFTDGYDELYWNVTGHESSIPIEAASATVLLPDGLAGLQIRTYTGHYGSQSSNAVTTEIPGGYEIRSTRAFEPREGLTIAVSWNPGVIARPNLVMKSWRVLRWNWVLLLPFLSFFLSWNHWKRHGKDPERLSIAPQYEPPQGLVPAEIGTLVDHTPDMRDITASLVDLAVRGYIRIEEREVTSLMGLRSSGEYTFHLEKPRDTWEELNDFERTLLRELFRCGRPPREEVLSEDLNVNFYKALPGLKIRLLNQMVEDGLYRKRPDLVVDRYWELALGLAATLSIVLLVAGIAGFLGAGPVAVILGGLGAIIPPIIFAPLMSRRTEKGTRTLEHVLGFEEFLLRAEKDRMERLTDSPEMFERYLPYAMALGVETKWARAFEGIYKQTPTWYIPHGPGHDTFDALDLMRGVDRMNAHTRGVMASRPRPQPSRGSARSSRSSASFGGGFGGGGGGGFSGGGFGGGGTGGF
jgi:uncharacterized membrane protein YgcG